MTEHVEQVWLHRLTTILLALTAMLFFWSTQAAWGRLELGLDRYKVGLLGVDHIFNVGSTGEGHEQCGWYDVEPLAAHCRPAPDGRGAYHLVRLADAQCLPRARDRGRPRIPVGWKRPYRGVDDRCVAPRGGRAQHVLCTAATVL